LTWTTPVVKTCCPRCVSIVAIAVAVETGAIPPGPAGNGAPNAETKLARLASIPASAASLIVNRPGL
jgi:hypothetical protein